MFFWVVLQPSGQTSDIMTTTCPAAQLSGVSLFTKDPRSFWFAGIDFTSFCERGGCSTDVDNLQAGGTANCINPDKAGN